MVDTIEREAPAQAPVEMRRYVSKYRDFRIQLEPSMKRLNEFGQSVEHGGVMVRFIRGRFDTSDPKLIRLLDNAPAFGSDFCDLDKQKRQAAAAQAAIKASEPRVMTGSIGRQSQQGLPVAPVPAPVVPVSVPVQEVIEVITEKELAAATEVSRR